VTLRTIESLGDLAGKVVLLRCDLNVPLKDGAITDDGRVRASVPTIEALLAAGATVVAMSHLGRPDGVPDPQYSLAPVARRLGELLSAGQQTRTVVFSSDTVGPGALGAIRSLAGEPGVVLLENLRFHPGEASNSADERAGFAAQLAALGDVVVSDGFGVVHRKQASVFELEQQLPSAAGLLIAAELDVLAG
jgi:phosphoglycerate kinase